MDDKVLKLVTEALMRIDVDITRADPRTFLTTAFSCADSCAIDMNDRQHIGIAITFRKMTPERSCPLHLP